MPPEEIESMTAVDVGNFHVDQSECKSSFTTYLNYVVHLEADHGIGPGAVKLKKMAYTSVDCEAQIQ